MKNIFSPSAWQRLLLASLTLLLLAGLVDKAQATGFYKDFVIANGNGNGNTYYYTNNNIGYGIQNFQGKNLGSFDRGTGSLLLGGEANTYSTGGDDVEPPQLFYRVYLQGSSTAAVNFTPLNLSYVNSGNDGSANNEKWQNLTTMPNLIAATDGPGTYVLEVYFLGTGTFNNSGGSGSFNFYDSNNGSNYTATFTVTGSVPVQWTGNAGDSPNSWFVATNWSPNNVPGSTTDVTIPYVQGGVIPKIASGTAQARTLNIGGSTTTPGALNLSQSGGELQVFGNFIDINSSLQQTGGTFTLAGNTQTVDGGTFFSYNVQGGGRKTLRGHITILTSLIFIDGVLATRTDNTGLYSVDLAANATINGESETSYVLGILRSLDRVVTQGQTNTFGNIGVELTATTGSPGTTKVTRVTGPDGFAYNGVGSSISIRRGFIFMPDNPDNQTFSLVFRYLDNELNGINENNLRLFRTPNGTTPFQNLGATNENPGGNALTRLLIPGTLAATFTLGDATNPLPVTLVSFAATPTAQGAASLRWVTASELNNKGFGIERQLEGATTWQSVGYVAGTNAAAGSTYSYLDKSLPAVDASVTKVYYRLRQEDLNGVLTYSPVATVSRQPATTELTLSPVPVSGDNLTVSFAEASQAGLEIAVVNMQGQRVLHFTTTASSDAALSLPVQSLAAGVYVVSVQVPGQSAARRARFVKL